MIARPLLLAAAAALLPCSAGVVSAQSSDRASKKDSTRTTAMGLPSFGLFGARQAGSADVVRWDCIGVCATPARVSAVGAVAAEPRFAWGVGAPPEYSAPRSRVTTPAADAAIAATAGAGGSELRDGENQGENEGENNGEHEVRREGDAEFPQASSGGHGRYAPALLATAAVGAGALWIANQGSDSDAALHTGTTQRVDGPRPTLSMNGPVAQPANRAATVPEPATWALLSAGLAALGVQRRRRR